MNLKKSWLIARKDLKLFFTDKLAVGMFLIFPFMFVLAFNALLSGIGSGDERLVLNLVTQEEAGGLSHQIISRIETKEVNALSPGLPQIVWLKDYNQANQDVADKKIFGFLAFPADFTSGVMTGYGSSIEVITDAEATNTRAALNGLADSISSQVGAMRVSQEASLGLLLEQKAASGDFSGIDKIITGIFAGQSQGQQESLVNYEVEKVGEVEAKSPNNYLIPGYLVMFVFFASAMSAEAFVRQRKNNTLERLMTRSVKPASVILGTFLGNALKGLVQIAVFWLVGIFVLKIDLGVSPVGVIILSLLVVIMSASFAVMLATVVKSIRAAGSLSVLISLVLAPIGGCWWPLFIVPSWMQFLAKLTPHGWANMGFNKLMISGADIGAVMPEMLMLVGFAVAFTLIGIWRFKTTAD